jgi:methionyl aminopeptidase
VVAVEPILAAGPGRALESADRWTIVQEHGFLAAHYEHTIVVREGVPLILTAAA